MSGFYAPWFFQQYRNAQGLPLAGGNIQTYISETTVPKALFYDYDLQNACPNPLPLDSAGFAPAFYLASGLYTFIIRDSSGNIISSRDNVSGVISSLDLNSISATSATYQIKIDENDTSPDFLWNKLSATDTIDFTNTGDKIAINVKDSWKIKSNINDPTPNYLNEKIMDTDTVILSISANKLRADFAGPTISTPGYLYSQFQNSDSITWQTSASKILANVISGKVQISSGDTLEYLEEKIQPGSGIVFTKTSDINGEQIHISTTNSSVDAGKVKVTSADSLDYLADKFVAGPGIIISADDNNIRISNTMSSNTYISSAIGFAQAITISSSSEFALFQLNLSAGTYDIAGNVCTTSAQNMLCNFSTYPGPIFDGYENWVFGSSANPLGTLYAPLVERRVVLPNAAPIYLAVQVLLASSSAPVWGSVYAKQVA